MSKKQAKNESLLAKEENQSRNSSRKEFKINFFCKKRLLKKTLKMKTDKLIYPYYIVR